MIYEHKTIYSLVRGLMTTLFLLLCTLECRTLTRTSAHGLAIILACIAVVTSYFTSPLYPRNRLSMKAPVTVCLWTLVLWGSACKKQDVGQVCAQVVQPPPAFLAYWFFPKGSYWVYRQRGSMPAVLDTVRVESTLTRIFQPGDVTYGLPTCTEVHEAHFSHSNRQFFRGYSALDNYAGMEHLFCQGNGTTWAIQQSNEAGNIYSTGLVLAYPFSAPSTALATTGPTLLDTSAVSVPAGYFRRSFQFATSFRDSTASNFLRRYQLSSGVGYTRKIYSQIGTWELISYQIAP